MIGVAAFKLHCYVVDTKSGVQFVLNPIEQSIIEVAVWFYEVSDEYDFGRAHRRAVKIMHLRDARQSADLFTFAPQIRSQKIELRTL
jgi:hypothetical protein